MRRCVKTISKMTRSVEKQKMCKNYWIMTKISRRVLKSVEESQRCVKTMNKDV